MANFGRGKRTVLTISVDAEPFPVHLPSLETNWPKAANET